MLSATMMAVKLMRSTAFTRASRNRVRHAAVTENRIDSPSELMTESDGRHLRW